MFSTRDRWGFDWRELITGVLFVIAGIFMFMHPQVGLVTMALLFAVVAIIRGITVLAAFSKMRQYLPRLSWIYALSGVLDLILGVLFLFNVPAGIVGITILFAVWFLIDAIGNLLTSSHLRRMGTGWFVLSLILDIATILVAILLIMQPVVAAISFATIVAIYLILFGINSIIISIARGR
ncbi:HdeD family acid-resistance protein [Lacticaseibacillus sharpeae]|uniref:Integral membrane protein n=1 Tax=Lacticaseibacillus sharpeae JCM 1186 = DSM 20505 TaxID=1291052 RepID=A0A0R1ZN73_9LACO|nr:DUF308 domain-containing protein [Lacticaseibacillus sharpeae]KRM56465.1 integral membrane protein [Lacticaseibacillus sharpeae JCM 1186 = DSM 20505]